MAVWFYLAKVDNNEDKGKEGMDNKNVHEC
jgi:hypothetical protein